LYRPSSSAIHEQEQDLNWLDKLVNTLFLMGYFTVLPAVMVVLLNWVAYWIAGNTFYQDFWMPPALLMLGTFLGGALMRQRMEDEPGGGMSLYLVGMAALCLFSWLTLHDIDSFGALYGQFMPKLLKPGLALYAYLLPAVGMTGMLFYKQFTLKHYN
jgi:hypothetical protein